jgi:hypothetical protein
MSGYGAKIAPNPTYGTQLGFKMLPYQLDQLDEAKLQQVCDDSTSESLTLEFKRELPGKEKADKVEFLKDVAALANAEGGDIIYGIEEKAGAALRPHPITTTSIEAEKRRLGQILDGGVEPRITGVRFQGIAVTGGFILVLRVPQSYDGPHRITQDSDGRFVLRSGTHTSDMSYSQLKNAFDRTATLAERAKRFRRDRLDAIQQGETPKPVTPGPLCVAHVIPLVSLTGRQSIDVVGLSRNPGSIFFSDWGHGTCTLNLDGIVAHSVINKAAPDTYGYNQIYRTGGAESVFCAGSLFNPEDKRIPSTLVTSYLRMSIERNIKVITQSGISGPSVVGIAMLNVKDYTFAVGGPSFSFQRAVADRDSLVLPEVWVESLDGLTDIDEIVRPMMDILWQSFGVERCLEYNNGDGKWNPRRN